MSEQNIPLGKSARNAGGKRKAFRHYQVPEPHPEKPPPNMPIPGKPSGGEMGAFKCKVCGKIFNIEEELKLHMKINSTRNTCKFWVFSLNKGR